MRNLLYTCYMFMVSTRKDVQLESCDLSFIWGKIRTAAQEAAPQIALRDCSPAAVREGNIYGFGEEGVQYHEALVLQKVCC